MLGNDDFGTSFIEVSDDVIAVESFVSDQAAEVDAFEKRFNAHRVEAVAGQEFKANEVAERIRKGQDLGGQAAFGTADGLPLSPPFAP